MCLQSTNKEWCSVAFGPENGVQGKSCWAFLNLKFALHYNMFSSMQPSKSTCAALCFNLSPLFFLYRVGTNLIIYSESLFLIILVYQFIFSTHYVWVKLCAVWSKMSGCYVWHILGPAMMLQMAVSSYLRAEPCSTVFVSVTSLPLCCRGTLWLYLVPLCYKECCSNHDCTQHLKWMVFFFK